jgi:putative ABC transport system permease protein
MIKHLLKIVWNRKRVNSLILAEIVLSFLVLFSVMVAIVMYAVNYRHPLGYSIDRVWSISVNPHLQWEKFRKEKSDGMALIERTVRDMPEIEAVGGIALSPYSTSTSISGVDFQGRKVQAYINSATDGTGEALSVQLIAGRWFSKDDDAATQEPAIINEQLARDLYGTVDVIGKELPFNKRRAVGVVKDFRKAGEFSLPVNYLLSRIRPNDTTGDYETWNVLVRLKPGITAEFQERLVKTLESVQKGWTFSVIRLEQARESDFRKHLTPLLAGAVIAGFLLFMVALGLIGVLWQNISRRTREIGLRRAVGSTARLVYHQILGELMVLTTIGLAIGTVIIIQFPLLNLISDIPPSVYGIGFIISVVFMYILALGCGLYPSWLTLEIQPAQALHYE